jgi:glycosyltransferase involved in cell wall biosynthesis
VKLSVIIATRNRRAFLTRALESLAAQRDPPAFEAIVVDNGSQDGTAALVRERAANVPFALRVITVPEPNRGAARNAGIAASAGTIVVFVDDDVSLPAGFLAAHAAAHADVFPRAVSGPILNVPHDGVRPKPSFANYSGAFFCTCNVSVPRSALIAAGGFDESFNLYGWEDTELGLRLRRRDVRRAFAWDAYLWHIKPPQSETLDVVYGKTIERATMAARLLRVDGGLRTKLATGAYALNLARGGLFAPRWSLGVYRALATDARVPGPLRALARAQLLDGAYVGTLRRALRDTA